MVSQGRADQAIQLFEAVGPSEPEDFHAMARAFMLRGQWSNALPLLMHVVQQQPTNDDALYELTSCRVRLGRLTEALESAAQFAAIAGNEVRGHVFLGSIHNDLANREKAAEMYAKALEYVPDANELQVTQGEFFVQYGRTLLAIGNVEEAARFAQRAIAIEPSGDAYELAAQCWQQKGNVEAAIDAWKQAIEKDPTQVAARLGLANDALQQRDHEAALELLRPIATSSEITAAVSFAVQRALTLAGEEEQAENWRQVTDRLRKREERDSVLTNLLREQPDSYWAKVVRAYRFAEEGNLQQAGLLMEAVNAERDPAEFVQKLIQALKEGGSLPSLDELPMRGDEADGQGASE